MSDEQPRMSRREMRAKGLLAPILDGASPLDDLTPTAEIRLKRLTRKEMREREAGLTREDSGSSTSDGHGQTASTGGSAEGVGAHGRFPSAIPERAGSAHEPASRASHADSSRTSTHHGGHAAPAEGFSTTGNITPVATVAAAEVGLVEGRWPAEGDDKGGKGASGEPGGLPVSEGQKPGADPAASSEATGSFAGVVPEAPEEAHKGPDSADGRSHADSRQTGTPFRNQPSSPQSTTGTVQPTPSSSIQSIPSAAQPVPGAPHSSPNATQSFANPMASRENEAEALDAAGRSSVFSRFDGSGAGADEGPDTKDRQTSRFPEANEGDVPPRPTAEEQYDPRASLKAPLLERLRRESEPGSEEKYSDFAPVPSPAGEVRSIDPEAGSAAVESGYEEQLGDIAEEDEKPRGWLMTIVAILIGLLVGLAVGLIVRKFVASGGDVQPVLEAAASVAPPGFGV